MIKGNKGEWSEIYTLFKLLGDQKLHLGNEDLEKIHGIVYPIIKILRTEFMGSLEYSIKDELVIITGAQEQRIPISTFKEKALYLLESIKESEETTFSVPEIEEFMNSIHCFSLKASSTAKTDITIVIHDQRTNQQPELGFSIKSQLGNPSTLLNAGRTTNFVFEITGVILTDEEILRINSIGTRSKIKDRLETIQALGGTFVFTGTERSVFSNNLILIDSLLPEILAEIVFSFFASRKSSMEELVDKLEDENPLGFDVQNKHRFYDYKVKRFLTDVALGMMPSMVWTGQYDATGGYLVVKEDGEVLCYHIYNRNEFENYLLKNTKLETASSTRHGFGEIYKVNNRLFFNLNLQIRFVK